MKKLNALDWIAVILTVIGGLNWGLVGIFKFDLVAAIFGGAEAVVSRIIYILVALAAIYLIIISAKLGKK